MNILDMLNEDLHDFFSDSENLYSEISDEEKAMIREETSFFQKQGLSNTLCARITLGDSCGFANFGKEAYVVNARNDRQVRATVRVKWKEGINQGEFDRVFIIPSGSRRFVGCTRSSNVPVRESDYTVVGCEVL